MSCKIILTQGVSKSKVNILINLMKFPNIENFFISNRIK